MPPRIPGTRVEAELEKRTTVRTPPRQWGSGGTPTGQRNDTVKRFFKSLREKKPTNPDEKKETY